MNIESPKAVVVGGFWRGTVLPGILLFFVTVFVFAPAANNGFVEWDDQVYVFREPYILDGIRWSGFLWSLTAGVASNWHPLTLLTLQLDAEFYGTDPHGYHWTSILLHAVNAVLTFLALRSLTGSFWRSLIVAGMFALHPMRVESVAWISERKDVVSGLFFWLTLLTYVRYTRTGAIRYYIATVLLFALGLASKPMLVTTPCVLLLLDFWPLGRLHFATRQDLNKACYLFLEKLPLLGLSFADSLVTINFQIEKKADFVIGNRIDNSVTSLVNYVGQTLWPTDLSPFYAHHTISPWTFAAGLLVVTALTLFAIYDRNSKPYFLVGWLWFVGMLIPVIGLLQVGLQARADRYTYLPQIGLFLAAVWGISDLVSRSMYGKNIAIAGTVIFLLVCSILTRQQILVWENTESMWRGAYRVEPDDQNTIQSNLTRQLYRHGKELEALQLLHQWTDKADGSDSKRMMVYFLLFAEMRQYHDCVAVIDRILKQNSSMVELIAIRGIAKAANRDWPGATDDFREAISQFPQTIEYQFQLAAALRKLDRLDEAHEIYANAIRRDPQLPQTIVVQAWDLSTNADPMQREKLTLSYLLELFVEEAPGPTPLYYLDVLAATYAHEGRFDEAIATAKKALEFARMTGEMESFMAIRMRLNEYNQRKPYRRADWFTPDNISDKFRPRNPSRTSVSR